MNPNRTSAENGTAAASAGENPMFALRGALRQLAELLGRVSDAQYCAADAGAVAGTIGGHLRHSLDHFAAFVAGIEHGEIDYDRRQRGTPIETSRQAALQRIGELERDLCGLDPRRLSRGVRVRTMLSADGAAIESGSTLGRELAFVLSHTIHHNALLAALCAALRVATPARFGYAPATIAHLDGAACAPSPSSA